MNIFVLDADVKKCAEYHCDKHCVKMILESTQLLCGVHGFVGNAAPYKMTHKNHPCSIWARESLSNYEWLLSLALELCNEYTFRYSKKHKCEEVLNWCKENKPNIPEKGITTFALAMPEAYKIGNAVASYRAYYLFEKKHIAQWTKREKPVWYN